MEPGEKVALVGLGAVAVTLGIALFRSSPADAATTDAGPGGPDGGAPDETALQPGFFDADAVLAGLAGTPQQTPPQPTGQAICTVATLSENHLRPTATAAASGPLYPAGTSLEVLSRTGITSRNGSPLYHVRVVADGAVGFVFLSSAETASCPQDRL